MHQFRLPALGRRLGLFLAVPVIAMTLAGATAQPAAAADPVLTVRITGAGRVVDVLNGGRMDCSSPNTTPSGVLGRTCNGSYPWLTTIKLRAIEAPGYEFAGWQGVSPSGSQPVHCDGADNNHFLRSGDCQFWTALGLDHLAIEARFVDTRSPDTEITSGPPPVTDETTVTFRFQADQVGSRFECNLDGAGFTNCDSPRTYSDLREGRHRFEVRAIDPSGNRDFSPATREFEIQRAVDTVKPSGTVKINNGAAATKSRKVTLNLTATDPEPGSGVKEMRIRNGGGKWSAWQPYAETKAWTLTKGDGRKTVYVEFRDGAGNVSAVASDRIVLK